MKAELRFNRHVPGELKAVLSYYEDVAGSELADAFYEELMSRLEEVQDNPRRFSIYSKDLRRANLNRFPYHFLYRITFKCVRVLVLKHDRRDPKYGIRRK